MALLKRTLFRYHCGFPSQIACHVSDFPTHLLLPLLASILFVSGLIFIKRTSAQGVSPWTVTFLANQWAAVAFSSLWLLGGTGQPWTMYWQPVVIGTLYILGQVFTFSAIEHGDVSVATPVFGLKVVIVAFLVTFIGGETLPTSIWYAAGLATIGITLVQWTGKHKPETGKGRVYLTIGLALLAALAFSFFDISVQSWAPAWGAGRLLPTVYWVVAVLSLVFLPFFQPQKLRDASLRPILLTGTLLIALQAICIVYTLASFGDAARVNVVYAMRGIWGVIFAWAVATRWGGEEAKRPRKVMVVRLLGATLLMVSVALALFASG